MQAAADIITKLTRASLLRRAPLWVGVLLPWIVLRSAPGLVVSILLIIADAWQLRRRVATQWPAWLNAALPKLEDSSALLEKAVSPVAQLQRNRLLERVDAALGKPEQKAIASTRVKRGLPWLALSLAAAAATWALQNSHAAPPASASALARAAQAVITLHVSAPAYTGFAAIDGPARDVQVPENSTVRWCLQGADKGKAAIELSDGQSLALGRDCAEWTATESIFWRWQGVRYQLRVTPDQAPQINISAPNELIQTLAPEAKTARMAIAIKDDYAITRATLHLTLARGSGENVRFSDREMPIPAGADPRSRVFEKTWSLPELGMEAGDELYFFVRAADNAERPHNVQSPTYTLRLPGKVSADDETAALPMLVKPENLRSQRQIIIDTEQLVADMKANPSLPYATVRARSETIAGAQGILRRRYGKFLGESSNMFGDGDDDGDGGHASGGAKQDVLHEFGHAHDEAENATLFDEATKKVLRRALSAMWDAERELRGISPKTALPPEYKALTAIKELQQADRIYLHKTAFNPPAIKEEKRMTGEVIGAKSYQREQSAADSPIPQDVRELIETLDANGPMPALWSRTAQDWIRARIGKDEQRLAAQAAVQDVADGCTKCRPILRAWLRGAISEAPVLLQAKPVVSTPFTQAWQKAKPGARP